MRRGFILISLLYILSNVIFVDAGVNLTGVNLSGAEFGSGDIPGSVFHNYVWDGPKDAEYFIGKGMNIYRIPFLWERMQLVAGGPLETAQLTYLHQLVNYLTNNSAYSLLDPHNYGSYFGGKIGQSSSSISLFADLWFKLANEFKNNPYVIFGLMNEPNNQNITIWEKAAQEAILAIRATGATNTITVPGNNWTGADTWIETSAKEMINIYDPADNFVYEVHQYLDIDSSGTHNTCVSATIGSQRLYNFTMWLKENKKKALLGEFGAGKDAMCGAALTDILTFMDKNDDVWFGWTYWSGGPWWGDWYFSNLTPNSTGEDRPQMQYIQPHIAKSTPKPGKYPPTNGSYIPPQTFAQYFPVYEDKLLSPFEDYSWAKHNFSYTGLTFNGSEYSIDCNLSSYGALWFRCNKCVDIAKWFGLEFWFNPGLNGSINHLNFNLMNGSEPANSRTGIDVGAYTSNTSTPNTWVKVTLPLGWFPSMMYDGFRIIGNSAGLLGETYFDQIRFVSYLDSYSTIADEEEKPFNPIHNPIRILGE